MNTDNQDIAAKPNNLRVEYVENPLGLNVLKPRFSWWVNDNRPAEVQTAYEIMVGSTRQQVQEDHPNLWHSGRVESPLVAYVEYAGTELSSGQRGWWKVRTFDSDGLASSWSDIAYFEMGLLSHEDWQGQWISAPISGSRNRGAPVIAMRRNFSLDQVVVGARMYVAALGDYRLSINGRPIGAGDSHAVWSNYHRECYYQTFDVSNALQPGKNALGLLLGDGFYSGCLPGLARQNYGNKPQVKAFLLVLFADGTSQVVATNQQWHWHTSWIMAADNILGEHVDAHQHMEGWDQADFVDSHWAQVALAAEYPGRMLGVPHRPLNVTQVLRPQKEGVEVSASPTIEAQNPANVGDAETGQGDSKAYVCEEFDFGCELYGRVRVDFESYAEDNLQIEYALDNNAFNQGATHAVLHPIGSTTDSYSAKGPSKNKEGELPAKLSAKGSDYPRISAVQVYPQDPRHSPRASAHDSFESKFAYHTFRFVRISYRPSCTRLNNVLALRTALNDRSGLQFKSDHATLNELVKAMDNSLSGVALTVPMRGMSILDRVPDTAYAATWVPLFAQQKRAHALVLKWLEDIKVNLLAPGPASTLAPSIAPTKTKVNAHSSAASVDQIANFETYVQVLWTLHNYQGDVRVLRDHYDCLRATALALPHEQAELIRAEVNPRIYGRGAAGNMVATCTWYATLNRVAEMAGVLGHLGDQELIEALAQKVKLAFRKRFLSVDGHILLEGQSVRVAALANDLLDEEEALRAQQELIQLLQNNAYQADVVAGVKRAILPVLTKADRLDMAYMVLLRTSESGWFSGVQADTTLLGRQRGIADIAEVGLLDWLVESLVGIALDADRGHDDHGYTRVRVQPRPPLGQQFLAGSPVQFVESTLSTAQGQYYVQWNIEKDLFRLEVTVPPGCSAVVCLPDGIEHEVTSGHHEFVMSFVEGGDGVPTLLDFNAEAALTQAVESGNQ